MIEALAASTTAVETAGGAGEVAVASSGGVEGLTGGANEVLSNSQQVDSVNKEASYSEHTEIMIDNPIHNGNTHEIHHDFSDGNEQLELLKNDVPSFRSETLPSESKEINPLDKWESKAETNENGDTIYKVEVGKDSDLLNGELPPNSTIEINNPEGNNHITITTDENGRIKVFEADHLEFADVERSDYQQSRCGDLKDGLPTDDAGHIQANEFGGPSEQFNYEPMDAQSNRHGEFRNMEKELEQDLKDGKEVTNYRVEIEYDGDSKRPTGFDVSYDVDGKTEYRYIDNTPRTKGEVA
jgi:hypothetical protein